jgi:hypothetical protein
MRRDLDGSPAPGTPSLAGHAFGRDLLPVLDRTSSTPGGGHY